MGRARLQPSSLPPLVLFLSKALCLFRLFPAVWSQGTPQGDVPPRYLASGQPMPITTCPEYHPVKVELSILEMHPFFPFSHLGSLSFSLSSWFMNFLPPDDHISSLLEIQLQITVSLLTLPLNTYKAFSVLQSTLNLSQCWRSWVFSGHKGCCISPITTSFYS